MTSAISFHIAMCLRGCQDTTRCWPIVMGISVAMHTGARAATKRVGHLKALEAIAVLRLLADDIENSVNKLGALSVVTLGPVVTGTRLKRKWSINCQFCVPVYICDTVF